MSHPQLVAWAPLLLVALAAVADLVAHQLPSRRARRRDRGAASALLLAFAALPAAATRTSPRSASSLLVVDRYALFFIGLVLVAGMATVALSYRLPARARLRRALRPPAAGDAGRSGARRERPFRFVLPRARAPQRVAVRAHRLSDAVERAAAGSRRRSSIWCWPALRRDSALRHGAHLRGAGHARLRAAWPS